MRGLSAPQQDPQRRRPERRVRVAFCVDNLNLGGTELNAIRTAEMLDRTRYDLRVVSLQEDGPLRSRYAEAGIPVHPLPIRNLYGPATVRQGMRLMRWVRENRIDVVHAHDIYTSVFAVPWARLGGARTLASRRWWEPNPGLHWKVATRLAYHTAHLTLANAPRVGRLVEEDDGVPRERVVVVPNFVSDAAFEELPPERKREVLASLGADPDRRTLGIVANLHPVKDHASLLRAVAELARSWTDLQLVMVGEGSMRPILQDLVLELGLGDRVVFAGSRPNHPNPHQLFEISVLCSRSEGFPNSIVEAMAAARPLVATEVGAVADAVVDGETGTLVPPRDPRRLADAIHALLSDPPRARKMGEAGRVRAREHFSPEVALGALTRIYDDLVGSAAPRRRRAIPGT